MQPVKIISTDKLPICPYCGKELETIERAVSINGNSHQVSIFVCPFCKKIIGVA